jgi:hypothetical protein
MNLSLAGTIPPAITEVTMSRKKVQSTSTKKAATAAERPQRIARGEVVTFRISAEEKALIEKAADRIPLARYSRDAVLAKATAEGKTTK